MAATSAAKITRAISCRAKPASSVNAYCAMVKAAAMNAHGRVRILRARPKIATGNSA